MKGLLIGVMVLTATLMIAGPALAVEEPNITTSLENISEESGLVTGDLPSFISTIIRWVLGLIGVILVALFVYGGVMYATSAGNEDRVETGKRIMLYAIIGVVIIVAAFLFTDYIVSALFAGQE